MTMKMLIPVLLVATLLGGCSRVPPSFSGVLVSNWANTDEAGIEPKGRGAVIYNPFTQDLYLFPLHIQRQAYKLDTEAGTDTSIVVRAGKDNTTVGFDAGLNFSFKESAVPQIFKKFRTDPEALATGFIKDTIRSSFNEAASSYSVMELLGAKLTEMQTRAEAIARQRLATEGIVVDQLYITGQPRIAPQIEQAINQTLAAIQEANRSGELVRKAQNDAKALEAAAQGSANAALIEARAQAEAAKLLSQEITALTIQRTAVEKWDGKLPGVVGAQALPFLAGAVK